MQQSNPLNYEGCDLYVAQEGGSDSPACGLTELLACASIQQAVNNAPEGATVCVKASSVPYGCPNATQEGGVSIARSMEVKAIEGRAIIDCQFGGRAFTISSATSGPVNVTLMGLDMRNGFAWGSEGGGGMVYASGPVEILSIVDCIFVNNSIAQGCGGAMLVVNVTMLSVENSTFRGNEALGGGALCSLDAEKVLITNTQFIENAATQGAGGGAIYSSGTRKLLHIEATQFLDNMGSTQGEDGYGGGAILSLEDTCHLRILDSSFVGNVAAPTTHSNGGGGGICVQSPAARVDIEASTFERNECVSSSVTDLNGGGGVFSAALALLLEGCVFVDNAAQFGGGLASNDNRLLVSNSSFFNNIATQLNGGAVFSAGCSLPRIEDSTFIGNKAPQQPGGALYLAFAVQGSFVDGCSFVNNSAILGGAIATFRNSGSQAIRNCTFFDNISRGDQGGALSSQRDEGLTVSHCAFVRNSVTDGGSAGGLFSDGTANVTIIATTFVNNTAEVDAGAAWVAGASRLTVAAGSAFTNNIARHGGGGGIMIESCGIATITASHFSHNRAGGTFGGAVNFFGTMRASLEDCHFANNKAIDGGAVYYDKNCRGYRMKGCRYVSNAAEYGGALFSYGVLDRYIADCLFANNTATQLGGGCLLIDYQNDSVAVLKNNTVTTNRAALGGGMAFWFWSNESFQASHNISHHFVEGIFMDNRATMGSGGAVSVVSSPDAPIPPKRDNPTQIEERAWNYTGNRNLFSGVAFIGNVASCSQCTGGALYINGGETLLRGCHFEKNQANVHGGAISVGGSSTQLSVADSFFESNQATVGGHLYSVAGGALHLHSSHLLVEGGAQPFFVVSQGAQQVSFIGDTIECSTGEAFVNNTPPSYEAEIAPWGLVIVHSIALQCAPCAPGQYSLQAATLGKDGNLTNITCPNCPDYADCSLGGASVFTLPGYWCGSSGGGGGGEIGCLVCPLGYCQAETLLPWNETCTGYRTGVLCGDCYEGYSEAWGTSECVPEGECGFSQSWWLILLALGFGLVYVVLLVWIPVGDHPLWKSLLYFMQIAALVVTANGQGLVGSNDTASGILNGVLTFFVLDPDILGIHVGVCPWSGLTAVQKMATGYVLPVTLFVELGLVGGGHLLWSSWWFRWRRGDKRAPMSRRLSVNGEDNDDEEIKNVRLQDMRVVVATRPTLLTREKSVVGQEEEDYSDDDISAAIPTTTSEDSSSLRRALLARYAAGIMALMLVTYESFTSVTMDLLHCVRSVGVDNSLVLFRAGTESCFSGWQIALLVFLGTVLVPFPISLVLLRWLIRSRTWPQHSTLGKAILMVLEKPYAHHHKWWESWSMFRRLALITLATFVLDPLGRAVALFGGCLFVLLTHLGANPYSDRRHNRVETVFLSDLVLISALDIPQATTQHLGSSLDDNTLSILSYTQSVLLLLPLAYCFLVVSLMLGNSLIRAIISRRNRGRVQSSDTVAYNLYTEDDGGKTASTSSALASVIGWIAVQVFLLDGNHTLKRGKNVFSMRH